MKPFEIITAPYAVYIAPSGTAFPGLDIETPLAPWVLLGINGTRSQDEDGVTITHEQTANEIRAAGSTGPLKAALTEESLVVAFNLMDLTLETYRYVLNGATTTATVAATGTQGTVRLGLSRGFNVNEFAMLVRGPSPYNEALRMQYEIPRVYESASAAPQFTKGTPAVLACEFRALEDLAAASDTARFGTLRAGTTVAL